MMNFSGCACPITCGATFDVKSYIEPLEAI